MVKAKENPPMKRSMAKLYDTARLRFPDDEQQRQRYVQRTLDAADGHDDEHYWFTSKQAWEAFRAEIIKEFGERPKLEEPPRQNNQPTDNDPSTFGPGSVLASAIERLTGQRPGPNCGCKRRMRQMNAWGWIDSWKNRETILGWLIDEARNRGHEIDHRRALGLLRAAWKEKVLDKNVGSYE